MAAKKTVARKKVTARKSPAKRRVTKREPKTIIKRKKTTAKRPAAKKQTATERKVERGAVQAKQAEQIKKLVDGGKTISEAAAKVGITAGLAKRLNNKANVSSKDRIVGTDKEVGKRIAALRDKEGVQWPVIRARTGMGPKQIRDLYESATGKSWRESGPKGASKPGPKPKAKTTAKAKPAAKRAAGRPKATAKAKTASARGRKAKPSAAKRQAKATAKAEAAPSGQVKGGRRAQRIAANKKVLDALHDLDTDNTLIPDMIEGKTLTVTFTIDGNKQKPRDYEVSKVLDVGFSDRNGRVIHYLDGNQQNRATSTREITAVN